MDSCAECAVVCGEMSCRLSKNVPKKPLLPPVSLLASEEEEDAARL